MKTIHLFLALAAVMLLGTAMPAQAQKKKKRTTTTSTRTNRTTTSTPNAQVNKKCAMYDIDGGIISCYAGEDYIYYVEKNENNAVMRIDTKTGDVSTYIPGIKGIYEGARPYISGVYVCGDKILLKLKGDSDLFNTYDYNMSLVVYNGEDVKTSPVILSKGIIWMLCCRDEYFVTEVEGKQYNGFSYWDPQTMKVTKRFNGGEVFKDGVWAPDGSCWRIGDDRLKIYRFNPKENQSYYWDLRKQSYVKDYLSRNSYGLEITKLTPKGDTLYIACGRRVYCINMISPDGISEYAKVPANMNYTFKNVWVDSQGNMLTEGGEPYEYKENNTLYWDVNSFDTPISLGQQLKTGFSDYFHSEIWVGLDKSIRTDDNGNFIIMSADGGIYIYNPKGIVGFTNAVGKIIKK